MLKLQTFLASLLISIQNFSFLSELFIERQYHAEEKKRFQKILFTIDKALSTLPVRIGRIRIKNQENLSKMSTGLECGDFEVIISDHPQNLEESPPLNSNNPDKNIKTLYVSNVTSGTNPEYAISKRVQELLPKTEKLNDLVNYLKEVESTPIEVLVNNELFAISLLKNEIRSAKEQIDGVPETGEVELNEKKNEVSDCQTEKRE